MLTGNQSVPDKVFMLLYANLCKLAAIPEKSIFCFNSVKYGKPTSWMHLNLCFQGQVTFQHRFLVDHVFLFQENMQIKAAITE